MSPWLGELFSIKIYYPVVSIVPLCNSFHSSTQEHPTRGQGVWMCECECVCVWYNMEQVLSLGMMLCVYLSHFSPPPPLLLVMCPVMLETSGHLVI